MSHAMIRVYACVCVRARVCVQVLFTSAFERIPMMGVRNYLSDLQCENMFSAHKAYSLSKLCVAMIAVNPTP